MAKDSDKKRPSEELTEEDWTRLKELGTYTPGVYRYTTVSTIGAGSTAKRRVQVIDYYIRDFTPDEENLVSAQVVDYTGKPIAMYDRLRPSLVAKCRLVCDNVDRYPEMLRKLHMLKSHVTTADRHYDKGEYHSAEYEYDQALKVEPKNVEASLGKGKTLFKLDRYEEAREIFDDLADNPQLYTEEHKHLFNEYGINLRQNNMYDKAIEAYKRAVLVNPNDPHLFYNLAVVYTVKRDTATAVKLAERAVKLKRQIDGSSFPEANRLLEKLTGRKQG